MLYAFKLGLSFDATRLCASDVDFPIDVLLYKRGSFKLVEHRYYREDLKQISNWWQERMRSAVDELPSRWVEAPSPNWLSLKPLNPYRMDRRLSSYLGDVRVSWHAGGASLGEKPVRIALALRESKDDHIAPPGSIGKGALEAANLPVSALTG